MGQNNGKDFKWNGRSYRGIRSSLFVKKAASQGRHRSRRRINLLLANTKLARATWGAISTSARIALATLTKRHGLSLAAGDLQFLEGRWYVTHSGLLQIAQRKHCCGIRSELQKDLVDPDNNRWIFRATIYPAPGSRGFVGYGDADPSNISPLMRGAELRIAETRAVNRALRKAYGVGLCSVEELGYVSSRPGPSLQKARAPSSANGNGAGNGQPRLRDRLCLLIRQHQLDPLLVKRYAADFCGTQELRQASRELVESFITTLAEQAAKDRDGLICKLNSYAHSEAVES